VLVSLTTSAVIDRLDDEQRAELVREAAERNGAVKPLQPTHTAPRTPEQREPWPEQAEAPEAHGGGQPLPPPWLSSTHPSPGAGGTTNSPIISASPSLESPISPYTDGLRAFREALRRPKPGSEALLAPDEAPLWGTRRFRAGRRAAHAVHVLLVALQLAGSIGTFTLPTFRRKLEGGLAMALEVRGLDFTYDVSFLQMVALAAHGGGGRIFMAAVFAVFNVVTPVLRALSLLALLLAPLSRRTARRLYEASQILVAYYSLDVMLLATPLINITFGPISEALISPITFPSCTTFAKLYHTGDTCLRIDVLMMPGYWCNVATVALMLLSGFDGAPTVKYIHRRLFPHDRNPPPSTECCR
jgi:hypothetical protein